MPPRKRHKLEIVRDRAKIAELYIEGKYQIEIGDIMGLSQQQISYDIRAIQKQWAESANDLIDRRKMEELAKTDYLERVYWQEWEQSKKEKTSQSLKIKDAAHQEKSLKREERCGDPRYLQGVQWCIEQRCKLLGIYQQADVSGLVINLVSSKDVNVENC